MTAKIVFLVGKVRKSESPKDAATADLAFLLLD